MINIEKKENCSGCHACYNICPNGAIKMMVDEKGFKYPTIDREKCIDCGLCEKVCPIINKQNKENSPKVIACYNKDEEIRMKSSSGGIFSLIAEEIINRGGVVCGAAFDEDFNLSHQFVEDAEQLDRLRTSKYLQSSIDDTYEKTKEYLLDDRYVLFTGTPCQIQGLLTYLGKDYDRLYTQDIVCHGVPSPMIWKKYMEYRKHIDNKVPKAINFRDKKQEGWHLFSLSFNYGDSEYAKNQKEDYYMKVFLKDVCLRDSCYQCCFRDKNRMSDITLADFWKTEEMAPELDDNKGTSLVLINSEKGNELYELIKKKIIYKEISIENAMISNPAIIRSPKKHNKKREKFFKEINNGEIDFERLAKKYAKKTSVIRKNIRRIKKVIKKIIRLEHN